EWPVERGASRSSPGACRRARVCAGGCYSAFRLPAPWSSFAACRPPHAKWRGPVSSIPVIVGSSSAVDYAGAGGPRENRVGGTSQEGREAGRIGSLTGQIRPCISFEADL